MTFDEVSDIVIAAKGIDHGFLYHVNELKKDPKSTRNQGGGFNSSHKKIRRFRVVLYGTDRTFDADAGSPTNGTAKGGFADIEDEDLFTAIRTAFEQMKLPLPVGIPAAPAQKPATKKK